MNHWLMKSEPDVFSIDDLKRVKVEPWNGVRNYQARNFIREMRKGDGVLVYHSSCAVPGVAGLATIASAPYPDFDAGSDRGDPRWTLVDVRYQRKLKRVITLEEIKALPKLGDFALTRRGNRLSVLPVTAAQWDMIRELE